MNSNNRMPLRISVGTWFILRVGKNSFRRKIIRVYETPATLFEKSIPMFDFKGGSASYRQLSIDDYGYLTLTFKKKIDGTVSNNSL